MLQKKLHRRLDFLCKRSVIKTTSYENFISNPI